MGIMNIKQLEAEIETWGLDKRNINIGERGAYDECFNLIRRKDGTWEMFYGEHGQKTNPQVFGNEEAACDAFYQLLKKNLHGTKLADKPKYWKGYQKHATRFQLNFITGIFIFCVLIGLFFIGYQIYTGDFGLMFWIWAGWIIVFGFLTYCSLNERRSEKFEFYGQMLIQIFCILLGVALMIILPAVAISQYISGETDLYGLIVMIAISPCSIVWIYFCARALKKEYGGYFKYHFKKIKAKVKGAEDPEDTSRSEDNL